jgi:hypothetical protein
MLLTSRTQSSLKQLKRVRPLTGTVSKWLK